MNSTLKNPYKWITLQINSCYNITGEGGRWEGERDDGDDFSDEGDEMLRDADKCHVCNGNAHRLRYHVTAVAINTYTHYTREGRIKYEGTF